MHGSNLLSVGVGTTTVPQTVVVGGGVLENKNNEASYHLFTFSKINFLKVVTRAWCKCGVVPLCGLFVSFFYFVLKYTSVVFTEAVTLRSFG